MRITVTLIALALLAGGCRDLVEPGRVGLVRNFRVVEGRIEGDEGLLFAARSVRFDSRAYGDTSISMGVWNLTVRDDGTFRTSVPRGTRGRADVALRWSTGDGRTQQYQIPSFELSAKTWVFSVSTRRLHGRVSMPSGYDEVVLEDAELTLESPGGSTEQNIWFVDVDAGGNFDTLVPRMDAVPRLVYDAPDMQRVVDLTWSQVDLDEELALEFGLEARWMRVRVPEDYPLAGPPRFLTGRQDSFGYTSRAWTEFVPGEDFQRVWFTTPLHGASWSIDIAGGRPTRGYWPDEIFDSPNAIASVDTLDFSVGDAMVSVDVRRDGEPLASALVQVETQSGYLDAYTSSNGEAAFAVPFGSAYLQATRDGRTETRWIDVTESRSILFDLTRGSLDEGL